MAYILALHNLSSKGKDHPMFTGVFLAQFQRNLSDRLALSDETLRNERRELLELYWKVLSDFRYSRHRVPNLRNEIAKLDAELERRNPRKQDRRRNAQRDKRRNAQDNKSCNGSGDGGRSVRTGSSRNVLPFKRRK
jgi:hypothetical protein